MPESEKENSQLSLEKFQEITDEEITQFKNESQKLFEELKGKFSLASKNELPIELMIDSIEESIKDFQSEVKVEDIGPVLHVGDGLAGLSGLPSIQIKKESQKLLEMIKSKFSLAPKNELPIGLMIDSIEESIKDFQSEVHFEDIGTVLHVGDGVASLSGLPSVRSEELVNFPTGVGGLVFSLEPQRVDVILLGSDEGIRGGDLVRTAGERLRIPVGPNLLGRVVNPLGEPLDGGPNVEPSDFRLLEREAPGIINRQPIYQPLHTGWKVIDALIPIGRGQRELILGDRQTGKTTIAVDAILQQKNTNVACIYVSIGQKKSSTLSVIDSLRKAKSLEYTTVVMAAPDDPPAMRYLAPYAGCTIAEYLMDHERDVLIIYDDLTKHANAYRELSLLLRRPPGREAYPGDIFYLHSRLLERAGKLNENYGSGSMTALPIVETQRGNLSAYIPTNLISITDGQIVLDTELFNQDIKPAVNVGLSVSRVGGSAQTEAMKKVAGELRLQLSQYEEVARFARLGTEVDETTQQQIEKGVRLQEILTQDPNNPLSLSEQVVILFASQESFLETIPLKEIRAFERDLFTFLHKKQNDLMEEIELNHVLTEEMKTRLKEGIGSFLNIWEERSMAE